MALGYTIRGNQKESGLITSDKKNLLHVLVIIVPLYCAQIDVNQSDWCCQSINQLSLETGFEFTSKKISPSCVMSNLWGKTIDVIMSHAPIDVKIVLSIWFFILSLSVRKSPPAVL